MVLSKARNFVYNLADQVLIMIDELEFMLWQKLNGEKSMEGLGTLTQRMNQLKRQIQAERTIYIKASPKEYLKHI